MGAVWTLGARAASLPDVAGFRPDVPAEQAYRMLQRYAGPNRRIDAGRLNVPALSAQSIIYALVMSDGTGAASAESIELDLTLPPGPQIVWRVSRRLTFLPGKELLVRNVLRSLSDKYGALREDVAEKLSTNPSVPITWWFTRSGHPASVPPGIQFADCDFIGPAPTVEDSIETSGAGVGLLQPLRREQSRLEQCRELTKVSAAILAGGRRDLARVLTVEVADLALEARAHDATTQALTRAANEREQRILDKEAHRPVPKL